MTKSAEGRKEEEEEEEGGKYSKFSIPLGNQPQNQRRVCYLYKVRGWSCFFLQYFLYTVSMCYSLSFDTRDYKLVNPRLQ